MGVRRELVKLLHNVLCVRELVMLLCGYQTALKERPSPSSNNWHSQYNVKDSNSSKYGQEKERKERSLHSKDSTSWKVSVENMVQIILSATLCAWVFQPAVPAAMFSAGTEKPNAQKNNRTMQTEGSLRQARDFGGWRHYDGRQWWKWGGWVEYR